MFDCICDYLMIMNVMPFFWIVIYIFCARNFRQNFYLKPHLRHERKHKSARWLIVLVPVFFKMLYKRKTFVVKWYSKYSYSFQTQFLSTLRTMYKQQALVCWAEHSLHDGSREFVAHRRTTSALHETYIPEKSVFFLNMRNVCTIMQMTLCKANVFSSK